MARMPAVHRVLGVCLIALSLAAQKPANVYPWLTQQRDSASLTDRIAPPPGFDRIDLPRASFADWLRHLPLKDGDPPVLLYSGKPRQAQDGHVAVIDLDVGSRDLQQCADTIIRLRAEYLFGISKAQQAAFNFTNGQRSDFSRWAAGWRPRIRGNSIDWLKTARPDSSHASFRAWLDVVFTYAGTMSLARELAPVDPRSPLMPGDIFIHPGSPGHAMIVADVARDGRTGRTIYLLAQGYMPAQDAHIVVNPNDRTLTPWYTADSIDSPIETPDYQFKWTDRKRFK